MVGLSGAPSRLGAKKVVHTAAEERGEGSRWRVGRMIGYSGADTAVTVVTATVTITVRVGVIVRWCLDYAALAIIAVTRVL